MYLLTTQLHRDALHLDRCAKSLEDVPKLIQAIVDDEINDLYPVGENAGSAIAELISCSIVAVDGSQPSAGEGNDYGTVTVKYKDYCGDVCEGVVYLWHIPPI